MNTIGYGSQGRTTPVAVTDRHSTAGELVTDILSPEAVDAIEARVRNVQEWRLWMQNVSPKWYNLMQSYCRDLGCLIRSERAQAARIEEQRVDNNALRKRIQDARPMVGLADD